MLYVQCKSGSMENMNMTEMYAFYDCDRPYIALTIMPFLQPISRQIPPVPQIHVPLFPTIIFHCSPVPQNPWESFSRDCRLNPKVMSVEKKKLLIMNNGKSSSVFLTSQQENPFRRRICEVFSSNGDGALTFDDFLNMMSVLSDSVSVKRIFLSE